VRPTHAVMATPSAGKRGGHGLEKVHLFCQDMTMRIGAFEIHEPVPDLQKPQVFTMVRPWVDVGSAASITLARLEHHFGAQELGRLARPGNFFDFTRYRPTIRLVDGRREVTIPNSVINYAHAPDGPDFLFCHLMEPHAFAEDYTDSVLEVLKHFGISRYARLGAMYDSVPHTRPLLVTGDTGTVPTKGNAGNLRRRKSTYQGPTSIMNLVSEGMPKLDREIETMNFMVHLPQYLQLDEDYAGAARLLEVLSSIYDLPPDLPPTEKGKRQYSELDKAMERNLELKSLIQQLESRYDADEAAAEEEASTTLSPEIERFLQEMDKRFEDSDRSGNEAE